MGAVKVVVLGGSGVATPELVNAIVSSPGRTRPIKLVLVGRSLEKLEKVAAVARHMAGDDAPGDAGAPEHTGGLLSVSHTTGAKVALSGADYVINQIRVGGLEARAFDETFPQELGLPGEETVGPGGFANASRTIPVVLEYARTMERVCPAATLLTFANPSSLVQYAITRYTQVHTIGLCDSPISLINSIAAALDTPADELTVDYVGMHHFGWVTGVWWRGRNVLPEALAKAADVARDVEPAITQAIGAIPGAYLNYVFHPDRMLARKKGKRPRAEELIELQDEILAEYERPLAARKPAALVRRKAHWYAAIVAPVLLALIESGGPMVRWSDGPMYPSAPIGRHRPPSAYAGCDPRRTHRFILNVVNGHTISWLPPEAVVEVPTLLEGGRVRPLATGPVPPDVQALVQANCTYEMLAVEAIVERDRAKALRALLANPIVHTYDQAAGVLERVWARTGNGKRET
jgi:6-phospho-beta-glucosidase